MSKKRSATVRSRPVADLRPRSEEGAWPGVAFGVVAGSLCVWNPQGYAAIPALPTAVGAMAAAVVVVGAIARGELRWSRVATWAAAGCGVAVATSLLSRAPVLGLLGAAGRTTGALTRVVWLVALLAGLAVGARPTSRTIALKSVAVASWVFAVMTLAGRLGADVVPETAGVRSGGPLGSAAFTGGALVLFLAVNGALAIGARDRRWQLAALFGGTLVLAALVSTGSRASWLGVVLAAPLAWRGAGIDVGALRRRFLPIVGIVAVGLAAMFLSGNAGRLASITESDGTAAGRVALWQGGLAAVPDTLIRGAGPDQQVRVVPSHLADDFERRFDDSVVTDRAHNEVLDSWLASGLLGVTTLLGGWWAIAVALRAERRDPVTIVLGAGLLAYAVHLGFNFSVAHVDLVAWGVVGLATAGRSRPTLARSRPVVITALVSAALVIPLLLDTWADARLRSGLEAERRGDAVAAAQAYSSARDMTPWQPQLHEVVARFDLRVGDAVAAMAAATEARRRSGDDPRWVELAAQAQLAAGDAALAEQTYRRLIAGNDHDSSLHEGLGVALVDQGRTDEARTSLETALELNPRRESAQRALDELTAG